jgi:beta-lactamase regulating signal transducer with metallopeptidase domain
MSLWTWLSHPWAVAITATLLHFLWQGTAIALLGVLLVRGFRITTPHARYAAWLGVFAALSAAPLVTLLLSDAHVAVAPQWPAARDMDSAASDLLPADTAAEFLKNPPENIGGNPLGLVTESETEPTQINPDTAWLALFDRSLWTRWQPQLLAVWMAGVGLMSLRLTVGLVWLLALGRRLQTAPVELQRRLERLAERIGLPRSPRLALSNHVPEPFAWRLYRPVIVLPASWLADVPPDVLEAVIAHELAHIRRHDLWVNLLQRLVETVLFFHPCVWWVSRQIRAERELCCDADAVAATGQAVAYARALETVALKRMACARPQLAVGLGGTRMALLQRVKQVLGVETSAADSGWWSMGLAGAGLSAACWTVLALSAPAVQGDDTPAADVAPNAVAQRDGEDRPRGPRDGERPDGPPRGPRDGERGEGPRGPREGDRPDGPRPPRDGDRPDAPRGPRDGERGPEGRPVPRFDGPGPRGEFGPPMEVMHEMLRAIRELQENMHGLRREMNEMREHHGRGPREGGPEGRPGPRFEGPGPRGEVPADAMHDMLRAIQDLREGMQGMRRELNELREQRGPGPREGFRGPEGRPFGPPFGPREGFRGPDGDGRPGPRPEARDGDRGPRPEGREGPAPGPWGEGRLRPRPEGREGDRGPGPEGRGPESRERRPETERPESERSEVDEKPVSAVGASA